jgi:hypothetical protein
LIAVPLLALGFGAGLYASDHTGSEDAASTARPASVAATQAETTAPTATTPSPPAASTTPAPQTTVEEPPPEFSIAPLPHSLQTQLRRRHFWHAGCPVPLAGLRLLTLTYRGFDHQAHSGALVVNANAAHPLKRVFRRLYGQRFPIRHIGFDYMYGPRSARPSDGDVTGSFECREAVPSPCTGGLTSGHWSNHAYGLAVDLNPTENPYIGCGQSRDPATKPYRDRSRHRRGMVDARVIAAFGSVGWGWGGAWTGTTKDYMHFSANGH